MKRNSIAEWALTFLLLAYSTTFIAQANVIPTSSMHNTVLTGDHLIVDKLAYSPGDAFSRHLLRTENRSAATLSCSGTRFICRKTW